MNDLEQQVLLEEFEKMCLEAKGLRKRASEMIRQAEVLEDAFADRHAPLKWGDEILVRKSSWGRKAVKKYRARVTSIQESFVVADDGRTIPCWTVRATNDARWDFYARYSMDKNGEYNIEFAKKKGGKR